MKSDSSSPMTFDSGYASFLFSLCVIIFLNYNLKLKIPHYFNCCSVEADLPGADSLDDLK